MNDSTPFAADAGSKLADRAVQSADQALDATRQAANAALDSLTTQVHSVHAKVAPALGRLVAPVDRVMQRTREQPIRTLLIAAATGAALVALLGLLKGR